VENSMIGLLIISVIALFGMSAFYIDFIYPNRRSRDK
jgi:hypothetical protein